MVKKIDKALGVWDNDHPVWDNVEKNLSAMTGLPPIPGPPMYSAEELLEGMSDDIQNDYEYQRQNFYNLVERGTAAVEGILELAKESEHPRTYEVAGNLIKQVAEVTEKLGDLQEKMRKLKEVPDTAPKSVTNALFVGSTAELQKMIKGKDDD